MSRMNVVGIAVISAALLPNMASAASTGSLLLSGTVGVVAELAVTPNGSNTSLDILAGESGKSVAAVTESSNNADGYKILMYSSNSGELRHAIDPSKKTGYAISYGGADFVTPPSASAPAIVKSVGSLPALTTAISDVRVSVDAMPTAIAGTYSDTVVFSIVAN